MAGRIELTLRPKTDVKPLDEKTDTRIGRVARAQTIELDEGGAVFGGRPDRRRPRTCFKEPPTG
jgi:hypothetical protein